MLDGVPFGQPALALAAQLQRRAARAGVPDELARLERTATPAGRTGPARTSVVSCSVWWPGPVRRAMTPRWSCAPLRAVTAICVRAWERS